MGFLKKLKFWKKRNINTGTKVDASATTEDPPRTCDASTVVSTVNCAAYSQTERCMDGGIGASKVDYESELDLKKKKIRQLKEDLSVSKCFNADLMLNVKSVEHQLKKYTEEPVVPWWDDCGCKQQLSAVADLLQKFIIMGRDVKKSELETTSAKNSIIDRGTQTEENSRQRDCSTAHVEEITRKLVDENRKLSALVEKHQKKKEQLKEDMDHMTRDTAAHIHHIKMRFQEQNEPQILKMRDMRDELLWYKKQLHVHHNSVQLQDSRSCVNDNHTRLQDNVPNKERTVTTWSEVTPGRRKRPSKLQNSESKPIPVIRNRYEVLNNCDRA